MIEVTIYCSNCCTTDTIKMSLKETLLHFQESYRYHVIDNKTIVLNKEACSKCSLIKL